MGTPVKAQGGGISPQSHSISGRMQTAFPNNFTADRYNDVNDHSGTQAVKDTSVSTLFPNEAGNNAVLHDCSPPVERTRAITPEVSITKVPFQKAVSTDVSLTG